MSFRNDIKHLEKSDEFKAWKKKDPKSYLVHAFATDQKDRWQFGYYNPGSDRITTFVMDKKSIQSSNDEVFKESGTVERLELDKLKIGFENAKEIAEKLRKEKYPNEQVNKSIFILQSLNKKMLWNITLVTLSFNLINVKIDAIDGNILSDVKESIMSLKK